MPTVTIRPGEVDEETIPKTLGYERTREIGSMRRVLIDVDRRDAQAVTLNRKEDTIQLGSVDTVRLVDIETGGPIWTLVCYSFEWDANRAGFTDGGNVRQGSDQSLITNLVSEVSSWSAGTINSFTGSLSFVFNHAHRHEAIRRIEKNVPGEIQFRDEGTVDYIDELGTDRSGSVELSASAGTIERQITITERGRELDGTHIRVLGAHEGEAQLFANLVPSDDSDTYTNRVNYTTSRWTDGDAKDWDRWVNKDVTDQSTLEEEAAALGAELDETLVEAETTVAGVTLEVGDRVSVVKPDANLDRTMRVHRVTDKSGRRNNTDSGATVVQEVLLSTRTILRTDDSADLRDIQRFNSGFQGSSVWGNIAGGIQAVDSGLDYQLSFFYPEVNFEHTAEIQVKSLPYRSFSSGAAVSQTTNFTQIDETSLSSKTTVSPGDSVTFTLTVPSVGTSGFEGGLIEPFAIFRSDFADRPSGPVPITVFADWGEYVTNTTELGDFLFRVPNWELQAGDTSRIEVVNEGSEDLIWNTNTRYQIIERQHRHDVDPGVVEFSSETASGVDVIVDGNTVATDINSGEFEQVVDITDELTKGAWNDVSVTSDTLGLLLCTVGIDAYRQIGKA